jgi:hypothetical protein
MDTFNRYMVGMQGGKIVILNPPRMPMENDDAIMFAATIIAMIDPGGERFQSALNKLCNS